jgi:hypothetical protein
MRRLVIGMLGLVTVAGTEGAEYNYHRPTELLVSLGSQALMVCNGLFVSGRALEQIYEQELKLERMPVVPPGMVQVDEKRRTVAAASGFPTVSTRRRSRRPGTGRSIAGRTDIPRRSP